MLLSERSLVESKESRQDWYQMAQRGMRFMRVAELMRCIADGSAGHRLCGADVYGARRATSMMPCRTFEAEFLAATLVLQRDQGLVFLTTWLNPLEQWDRRCSQGFDDEIYKDSVTANP